MFSFFLSFYSLFSLSRSLVLSLFHSRFLFFFLSFRPVTPFLCNLYRFFLLCISCLSKPSLHYLSPPPPPPSFFLKKPDNAGRYLTFSLFWPLSLFEPPFSLFSFYVLFSVSIKKFYLYDIPLYQLYSQNFCI